MSTGVTYPQGFRAAGVAAGIKSSGNPDVAVVVNDGDVFAAAGVFTSNRVKAAPVLWSEQVLSTGSIRAVALNSGGANACTGPAGFQDTHRTAEHLGAALGIGAIDVAVCSTGLIGERLPMESLMVGIDRCVEGLSVQGGADAATAIMTTDSVSKQAQVDHPDGFRVGGMAKGAGMLAPGLATMLVVLTTDAVATANELTLALSRASTETFDRIDSDGCMSTNDTVLLMASGASGVTPSMEALGESVRAVCSDLARQLIADAEGATKDIRIEVRDAASIADAVEVARAIGRSNLFKCAIHGEDPNWGRVLAAVGTTAAAFDPEAIDVAINGVWVCKQSAPSEDRSRVDMAAREVHVVVRLHSGDEAASVWTNDLTAMYVHENSAYSS
jgi:glutamate N-acetyltransferase / amino-acid N-acetyltransferase